MHVWAYDHTRAFAAGQGRLVFSAISGRTTHEDQEARTTAFHEGFAEYAARQALLLLFNTTQPLPRSRAGLAALGLRDIDQVLRSDEGWESILTTLSTPGLRSFVFGTSAGSGIFVALASPAPSPVPLAPFVSFSRILGCFARDGSAGEHLRLGSGEMRRLEAFLKRVEAIVGGAMVGRVDEYLRLFDPNETVEPATLFA
jgi:hypothetical protein